MRYLFNHCCVFQEPICTVILRGMMLFGYTYDLQGLRTAWWERALTNHIKKDNYYYTGTIAKHTTNLVTSEFSITYDAIMLFGYAVDNIIQAQKTITGASLAEEIRQVQLFSSLTQL